MRTGLALGFVSESPPWHLISPLFPDKVGGRPAWLALKHLPSPNQLQCPYCKLPMVFVLQVYSTIDDRPDCFHRFLYLFMCRNGPCHDPNNIRAPFIVFRSQLSRSNPYYSYEPMETETPSLDLFQSWLQTGNLACAERFNSLCPICGCKGDKSCSQCKRIKYCSKSHQVIHWKESHKALCGAPQDTFPVGPSFDLNSFLLPEFKLCSEPAERSVEHSDESCSSDSAAYETSQDDEEFQALEALARHETDEEARFRKFRDIMSPEPDQVLRLQRGGEPIWLTATPPSVPDCDACGEKRIFEFQVTPQLLQYLKLDKLGEASPDFGSLYIFTCSTSCTLPRTVGTSLSDGPNAEEVIEYQPEVVIRQLVL
ncbi:unnamed protein product [Dicrocoelium dendriticum]|nr:unnamed protein product [Dicrocoelium dendriticum]